MRALIRCLALCVLGACLCTPLPGQSVRSAQDSLRNRSARDSLKSHSDSTAAVIMTVDSAKAKPGTVQQQDVRKPRSSTVRTVERQTASHAAKNAPRVKNAKPTTR